MQSDVFIVITNKESDYWLEMYKNEKEEPLICKALLLISQEHVIFDIQHCKDRKYTSIYAEELKLREHRVHKRTLFLLDSKHVQLNEFRSSPVANES